MTYAIVEIGGGQIRVEPGRFYDINLLAADPDSDYTIDKVLLVHNDDDVTVGRPYIEGATVEGTVMRHRRGKKVIVYKMQATILEHLRSRKTIVYKMRPKKKTRKKRGHRQELTRLMINSISLNGSVVARAEAEAEATTAE